MAKAQNVNAIADVLAAETPEEDKPVNGTQAKEQSKAADAPAPEEAPKDGKSATEASAFEHAKVTAEAPAAEIPKEGKQDDETQPNLAVAPSEGKLAAEAPSCAHVKETVEAPTEAQPVDEPQPSEEIRLPEFPQEEAPKEDNTVEEAQPKEEVKAPAEEALTDTLTAEAPAAEEAKKPDQVEDKPQPSQETNATNVPEPEEAPMKNKAVAEAPATEDGEAALESGETKAPKEMSSLQTSKKRGSMIPARIIGGRRMRNARPRLQPRSTSPYRLRQQASTPEMKFRRSMPILVKLITGKSTIITVDPRDTIWEVQKMLQDKLSIPVACQRLTFCGRQLQDRHRISKYGIRKESTIHMAARLHGGMQAGNASSSNRNFNNNISNEAINASSSNSNFNNISNEAYRWTMLGSIDYAPQPAWLPGVVLNEAEVTPEQVSALVRNGKFQEACDAKYIEEVQQKQFQVVNVPPPASTQPPRQGQHQGRMPRESEQATAAIAPTPERAGAVQRKDQPAMVPASERTGTVQNKDQHPNVVLWSLDRKTQTKIPNGDKVTIMEEINDQYKVKWKDQVGMVKQWHIQAFSPPASAVSPPATPRAQLPDKLRKEVEGNRTTQAQAAPLEPVAPAEPARAGRFDRRQNSKEAKKQDHEATRKQGGVPQHVFGKMHYLLVGNPGVGKSTLLNAFIGDSETHFRSGVSFGGGLTTNMQSYEDKKTNSVFLDTPGLDDAVRRQECGEEIAKGLRQNGNYKLFFIVTLQAGRVLPSDKTTMNIVIEACQRVPNFNYSVIINKVPKITANKLADKQGKEFAGMWNTMMEGVKTKTSSIFIMDKVNELEDENDQNHTLTPEVIQFIKDAPVMLVQQDKIDELKVDEYQALQEEYEARFGELKADKEKQEALNQAMQKDLVESQKEQTRLKELQREEAERHQAQVLKLEADQKQVAEELARSHSEYMAKLEKQQLDAAEIIRLEKEARERSEAEQSEKFRRLQEEFDRKREEQQASIQETLLAKVSEMQAQQLEAQRQQAQEVKQAREEAKQQKEYEWKEMREQRQADREAQREQQKADREAQAAKDEAAREAQREQQKADREAQAAKDEAALKRTRENHYANAVESWQNTLFFAGPRPERADFGL